MEMSNSVQSIQQRIENMVSEIAKETKISKVKLMTVAMRAIEIGKVTRAPGAGRKLSEESSTIRNYIISLAGTGQKFTAKQLAQSLNVEPALISNAIRWAQNNNQQIVSVGIAEKPEKQRGKPATVWQFN